MAASAGNLSDSTARYSHNQTAGNSNSRMICGVAIDVAMNSIFLRTADGDTIWFGYPG